MFDSFELAGHEERDDFEYNDAHIELESDSEEYGSEGGSEEAPAAWQAALMSDG